MSTLSYDVMVCTLNRPDSVRLALSKIETQSIKPRRVIVVDASDDHEGVKRAILVDRDPSIDWRVERSPVRSLPYQRNLGLDLAESPVLLAPDDDSVLYPNTAANILAAYEADTSGVVAAVSGQAAARSPDHAMQGHKALARTAKDVFEPARNHIERLIVRKPFETYPQALWETRTVPSWISEPFALVETVGGFLLSLRTEIIQKVRFDETLGYGIGYALHEDMELSLRLQRLGYLLVAAHNAPIYHDVHPSRRAGGFQYGFCWILNYVYACRRNIPEGSRAWREHLPRFLAYKIALYQVRALVQRDAYAQDVLDGAKEGRRASAGLAEASPDDAPAVYWKLCDQFLRR